MNWTPGISYIWAVHVLRQCLRAVAIENMKYKEFLGMKPANGVEYMLVSDHKTGLGRPAAVSFPLPCLYSALGKYIEFQIGGIIEEVARAARGEGGNLLIPFLHWIYCRECFGDASF